MKDYRYRAYPKTRQWKSTLRKFAIWLTSSTFLSQLTSQHPYMETFIKKPHVYTIDINDLGLVEASIKEIVSRKVKYETSYH